MEVSALRYSGGIGLHGRSPLLRLQSDERLIALIRRGNSSAFEVLVSRYHSRLLAFCRHLLGSKEDAEDVLQEVLAAAFNAILADERPINVRPWLYRIARNRSLNHLRRIQAIGVDSMDIHFSENGASTADKVHAREQFRLLVGDIQGLPETQRTALVLREMDALSYEQIAEAMDTTVPGVKSLLVRARISLAEAAEARQLSCDEVRIELAEVAEGLVKRPTPLVRRHLRTCRRCASFQSSLKQTNKALAALLPIGPLALLRQVLIAHIGHSAGTGSGAAAGGATAGGGAGAGAGAGGVAAGQAAAVAGTAGGGAALGSAGGLISAGAGAIATKAAAGLAAAALVTAGAVEASHVARAHRHSPAVVAASGPAVLYHAAAAPIAGEPAHLALPNRAASHLLLGRPAKKHHHHHNAGKIVAVKPSTTTATKPVHPALEASTLTRTKTGDKTKKTTSGHVQTQTDPTVLSTPATTTVTSNPSGGATSAPDTNNSSSTPTGSSSSSNGWSPNPSTTTSPTPTSASPDPTTTTTSSDPTASSTPPPNTTSASPTDPTATTGPGTTSPGTTDTGTTDTGDSTGTDSGSSTVSTPANP
jgi:RNA polymerase sigma factor (sigma-70 family)